MQLLKQVLVQLHTRVMPALANPLLLADFLTSCLDQGGMLGMLALNGSFTLVTKHGLEYPAFYARLYALLQASPQFCVLKPAFGSSAFARLAANRKCMEGASAKPSFAHNLRQDLKM